MSDTVRVRIVVYEDDRQIAAKSIGYFHAQPYQVRLDTPDGTDWQIDRVTVASLGEPQAVPEETHE